MKEKINIWAVVNGNAGSDVLKKREQRIFEEETSSILNIKKKPHEQEMVRFGEVVEMLEGGSQQEKQSYWWYIFGDFSCDIFFLYFPSNCISLPP